MIVNNLKCPICDNNNTHFLCTVEVSKELDSILPITITIDGSRIKTLSYPVYKQGIIHYIYACENGEYFAKSFDGNKGVFLIEENFVIKALQNWLNYSLNSESTISLVKDSRLIEDIEYFFRFHFN